MPIHNPRHETPPQASDGARKRFVTNKTTWQVVHDLQSLSPQIN